VIAKHLGNGVMLFEDVIDTSSFSAYLERIFAEKLEATNGVDIDSSQNDGGYTVEESHASELPIRFHGLSNGSEFLKEITESIDNALYKCLVEYCRSFPVAIDCIRWRTSGQVASYSVGQNIGPHSDCSIPYDSQGNVLNSFPLHNTLTASMVLNDGYEGGAIEFRPWAITANPKIGCVLIYPSSFMGCHEVKPITSGVRNVYLQWFCQGKPEMHILQENELNSLATDVQHYGQKYVTVGIIKHD
jgi:predicted 2-oxoglutarate/Fe(II)-dependent dioxygenase YbiX